MTMTAQEYRANARQCLSWGESARVPENREAFFALAATWESVAVRIERSNAVPEIRATRKPSLRRGPRVNGPGWTRPL
jgi:ferric-dicitrate binding protein FerR (iron transport regulator)